jgi:hypothetical protein
MSALVHEGESKSPVIGIVAACASLFGVVLHFWVGWDDAHRIVFRPVGHLTFLLAYFWVVPAVLALSSMVLERKRAWAVASLILAVSGWLLLL